MSLVFICIQCQIAVYSAIVFSQILHALLWLLRIKSCVSWLSWHAWIDVRRNSNWWCRCVMTAMTWLRHDWNSHIYLSHDTRQFTCVSRELTCVMTQVYVRVSVMTQSRHRSHDTPTVIGHVIHEWVMSPHYVTHINESCHTYEWVMSHANKSCLSTMYDTRHLWHTKGVDRHSWHTPSGENEGSNERFSANSNLY